MVVCCSNYYYYHFPIFSPFTFHCSDNRKVVIVERLPFSRRNHRHVSYHGDICADLDVVNGVASTASAIAKDCGNGGAELTGADGMDGVERGGALHDSAEAWGAEGVLNDLDSRVMRRASRVLMYVLVTVTSQSKLPLLRIPMPV